MDASIALSGLECHKLFSCLHLLFSIIYFGHLHQQFIDKINQMPEGGGGVGHVQGVR